MTLHLSSGNGKLPTWFGVPFIIGGVFMAVLGFVLLQDELRYGSEGVSVSAVVTDTVYFPGGGDDGPSYELRYAFVDPATGVTHDGRSDVDETRFDRTSLGETIEVTYLPADPGKSRVGSPEPQLVIPLIIFGGAALFLVVGVGLLWLMRRIRRGGLPSWVTITSAAIAADPRAAADEDHDLTALPEALAGLFGAGSIVTSTSASSASAAATSTGAPPPAEPDRPLTQDELRAIDARLAPPSAPPATAPRPDEAA